MLLGKIGYAKKLHYNHQMANLPSFGLACLHIAHLSEWLALCGRLGWDGNTSYGTAAKRRQLVLLREASAWYRA